MAFREETLRRRQKEGFREENRWAGVTPGGEKSGDLGEGLGEVASRAFGAREQVPRKLTREGVAPASHPPALAMKVTERLRDAPLGPGRCLSPARIHSTCPGGVCKRRVRRGRRREGDRGGRCRLEGLCRPEASLFRVAAICLLFSPSLLKGSFIPVPLAGELSSPRTKT